MKKGDIVLIPFPFINLKGSKKRPAVILYKGKMDVIVSFITSRIIGKEENELLIAPHPLNGLKKPSLIRVDKIATLDIELVVGKIGELNKTEILELDLKLGKLFDL